MKKRRRGGQRSTALVELAAAGAMLALIACAAVLWFYKTGQILAYGDAEAHLNIARKLWDNYQPAYREIGTVWLPVPHLLMLPFTYSDRLYQNGLAGAIPSALSWIAAGMLLYAAVRKLASGMWEPAACAVAVFALNPNLLYLASTPMTEPVFYMEVAGLLYALAAYRESGSVASVLAAVAWTWLAALTRYEGWLLIPVAALCLGLLHMKHAVLYVSLACLAPVYIFAHNWWIYGDALEFYRGEWSPRAIYDRTHSKGFARFPGEGSWATSFLYYRTAAALAIGQPALWIGLAGVIACLWKRWFGLVLILLAGPLFTIWGMRSGGGVEIFVPTLWPHSYYNTRYALALLLPAALGAAALVASAPRLRGTLTLLLAAAALLPWLAFPHQDNWIVWKEGQVNSAERRAWTHEMAVKLAATYQPGEHILYSFGDLTGILREARVPLHFTLQSGNEIEWLGTLARPDLLLNEEWVLDFEDGKAAAAARKRSYRTFARIDRAHQAPAVELFRRP